MLRAVVSQLSWQGKEISREFVHLMQKSLYVIQKRYQYVQLYIKYCI